MSDPNISVVIPCYNAQNWIRETLNSVVNQEYENAEIIVVDDGSTDASSIIIEREFPFVKLIKTENNGVSRARNIGTDESSGEFIQYLDADDLLEKNKLKIQIHELIKSEADVAYGDWQRISNTTNGSYVKCEEIVRRMSNPEIDLFTDFWCPPAVYLFRRSIVEKALPWHEKLAITQDARFVHDCALQGGKFIYCPGILASYRTHKSGSLSKSNPIEFATNCLTNADEIEDWWRNHGGLTKERLKALVRVYGFVARSSYGADPKTFESAYRSLERLTPNYVPDNPKHLRIASLLLGYRKAEALAVHYRVAKAFLNNATKFMSR